MKRIWRRNWKALKVSKHSLPHYLALSASLFLMKCFLFLAFVSASASFIYLLAGCAHTHLFFSILFFSVGKTDCWDFVKDLQGQVLCGLRGMCWGVPLLVVSIFRTLLGNLIAPGNKDTLRLVDYKNRISWFIEESFSIPHILHIYSIHMEYFVIFFPQRNISWYVFLF